MNKSVIIIGEASETDSEDESFSVKPDANMMTSIQGAVITGEDSESELENDASISSAVSALHHLQCTDDLKNQNPENLNSLLQQKLRENNNRLLHSIDSFCNNTIDEASKSLSSIDQHLIKSQLTLQNAVTSFKSLSANSLALKNKLHSLLTAKFIPNINTTTSK